MCVSKKSTSSAKPVARFTVDLVGNDHLSSSESRAYNLADGQGSIKAARDERPGEANWSKYLREPGALSSTE